MPSEANQVDVGHTPTLRVRIAISVLASLVQKAPLLDREGEHGPKKFTQADLWKFRLDMVRSALDYADAMILTLRSDETRRSNHDILLFEAKKLLALIDDVGTPDGDESDRVFSRYEFEGLRAAIALATSPMGGDGLEAVDELLLRLAGALIAAEGGNGRPDDAIEAIRTCPTIARVTELRSQRDALLAACKALVKPVDDRAEYERALDMGRAAIALAEGRA